MVSTYGSNLAISGQTHAASWGRTFKPSTGARGVVAAYGVNSTALSYILDDPGLAERITEGAHRPVATFAHAALWGNSTAQGYIGNLRTYGQSNWGFSSGKVDLLGRSAGAAAALNWAKANPTLVNAIALLIPAVDLQDIDTNNRGSYSASIEAAWGGAVPDASNPADNTASFTGFPIAIWRSTDDPVCVQSVVDPFASAVGATVHSLGAIGHSTSSLVPQEVADFFAAH